MLRTSTALALCLALLSPASPARSATPAIRAGRVVVGLIDAAGTTAVDGFPVVDRIPAIDAVVVAVPAGAESDAAHAIAATPGVVYAEPDAIVHAFAIPDDPYYAHGYATSHDGAQHQWGLERIGAPKAWDASKNVHARATVAVLDSGVDLFHPDLRDAIAPDDTNDPCGCLGVDLVNGDGVPQDDNGHGTHVAGIVAATTGNGTGVAGLGWDAIRIMPVKVMDANGAGDAVTTAKGIVWAADHGADVITMSLGGPSYAQVMQDAVNYAWLGHGRAKTKALVVAAAGNDGAERVDYPAGLNHVLGVGATMPDDTVASFSNTGRAVAIGAPGWAILSTTPVHVVTLNRYGYRTSYDALDGTSMATPFVAAAGALTVATKRAAGSSISPASLWKRLEQASVRATWSPSDGFGRLDAAKTVSGSKTKVSTGGLSGQVVAANGRTPVSGAVVSTGGKTFTTGPDGMYRLEGLPTGKTTIRVATGGATTSFTATVVAGSDQVSASGAAPDVLRT